MKIKNLELNEDFFNLENISSLSFDDPLFSYSNLIYQKFYREDILESNNISFEIRDSKNELIYMLIGFKHITNNGLEFSNYGLSINVFEADTNPSEKKIIINEISKRLNFNSTIIYNQTDTRNIDIFSNILIQKNKNPSLSIISSVDLTIDYNIIRQSYRKSYKSLISKFSKTISTEVYNSKNINENIYKIFKDLHFREAGRITRSEKTWEQHYKMILRNEAILICAELNNIIIGAALFIHSKRSVYYGVSASDEKLKHNTPITHLIIDKAILYYKDLGYEKFILGSYEPNSNDEKLRGISSFKSAFSNLKTTNLQFK